MKKYNENIILFIGLGILFVVYFFTSFSHGAKIAITVGIFCYGALVEEVNKLWEKIDELEGKINNN